jgi:L-threonylcarbamoyladenylate synthase
MEDSQSLSRCSIGVIQSAAQALCDGNLVAFPTETVYGLGADATNAFAVAKIYKAKGRPADHPLIVHVHSMLAMESWVSEVPNYAISLARDFWPGPMTLILKRSALAQNFVTGGQDSVGIRIPDHPIALALLQVSYNLGVIGVAAPSANRFGQVSPTTVEAVQLELASFLHESDQILNGGQSTIGLESTIVDCTSEFPKILRPGAVTIEMIQASTGFVEFENDQAFTPRVSGALEKHYSPLAQVILDQIPVGGQGYLATSNFVTPHGVTRLASPKDNNEFARDFYMALRKADELGLTAIVVQQPIGEGIAVAIRDRALRASNGR